MISLRERGLIVAGEVSMASQPAFAEWFGGDGAGFDLSGLGNPAPGDGDRS